MTVRTVHAVFEWSIDCEIEKLDAFLSGGLSVAVPSEVKGYWEAHQRFGKLPWSRLVEPTIAVCEEGSIISNYQANIFLSIEQDIRQSETLRWDKVFSSTVLK